MNAVSNVTPRVECDVCLQTPLRMGAIAVVQLSGDVDGALKAASIRSVAAGAVALRNLCGVDRGVVARWSHDTAHLTPHGGVAVISALLKKLQDAGLRVVKSIEPQQAYPEAEDAVEALMLDALARAASPLAIDALCAQPDRWRRWDGVDPGADEITAHSTALNRLIDPPTIAAVGWTNIGKSALVNALARRSVSIVADEPGVTRDHVGVTLELEGLAVRWVDTPGLRRAGDEASAGLRGIERDALELAHQVIEEADLVLECGDVEHGFADHEALEAVSDQMRLRVATRADRGVAPGADVITAALPGGGGDSAQAPWGLAELARAIRLRLLPDASLHWSGPWLFDKRLPTGAYAGEGSS